MKIQPLRDQLIGKRFWYNGILHTIAYLNENYQQYAITYYRLEWVHRKYQRGAKCEKVFYKVYYSEAQINELFAKDEWLKYENKSTTNIT